MNRLTHIDSEGRARMVDVSAKPATVRSARASGRVRCAPDTVVLVEQGKAPKGRVIETAELAGVMAAKRTADLIPLCHTLALSRIAVDITVDPDLPGFRVTAEVGCSGPTGVEMEALTAVSIACLTLFDMLKAIDRAIEIGGIRVEAKSGGRSCDWVRT